MSIPDHEQKLQTLLRRYAQAHPASRAAMQDAARWLPGGNTRSVLHYDPFPLVITAGDGSHVQTLDGPRYLDCVGEFSAGLYGHCQPAIQHAIHAAVNKGLTLGGPNTWEAQLARLVCERFDSVERIRFCNSGTEANLFALATALAVTGRRRILVFDGAYHGGVLTFGGGTGALNVPYDYALLPYNDADAARRFLQNGGSDVAAILVEPILGAAGNIPGQAAFLQTLREESARCGAILIFDEVKTSRCGPGGIQGLNGVCPDMTTFGKYLGGGLPLGAFGGRADIMDHYDPQRPQALKHAGTFNNNAASLAAGTAGLSQVYTPERASAFHARTTAFKTALQQRMQDAGLALHLTGHGSFFSLHIGTRAPENAAEVTADSIALRRLLQLRCLELGVRLTGRGDLYLNLAMTDDDLAQLGDALLQAAHEMLGSVTFA